MEVIDGQQRLTAITLIAKILDNNIKESKLFYDSRPEVEAFFYSYYNDQTDQTLFNPKISHLIDAIDFIKDAILNPSEVVPIKLTPTNKTFKDFFFTHVILVRVEVPEDTDVANYFEIMNNRGQQLQLHEILKAKLLDKIKHDNGDYDREKQKKCAKIWDACSQMNDHIQNLFETKDMESYFGANYDRIEYDEIKKEIESTTTTTTSSSSSSTSSTSLSIVDSDTLDSILSSNVNGANLTNNTNDEEEDDEGEDKSIIDFPNFLMHILKLLYNNDYKQATKTLQNPDGIEIPLNEKDLLLVFYKIMDKINPVEFIGKLLYYRAIFDRFIVKETKDEKSDDKYKWTLQKPYKYRYDKNKNILKYKNTFDDVDVEKNKIIKSLSMLQVSERNKKYKNFLQEVLSWFSGNKNYTYEEYGKKIDKLIYTKFDINNDYKNLSDYSRGTDTPHFLFNFIDYLYWIKDQNEKTKKFDFDFRYRNSVEHHLPQSFNGIGTDIKNRLGNLCLVSKGTNSRMNNESPTGKADKTGKYYKNDLPPKRKTMYDITNKHRWSETEIIEHQKEVVQLLKESKTLLGITE
jgi:hypothetical protein